MTQDRVYIERFGDRIRLKTDYTSDGAMFDRNLRKIKSVAGASWAKSYKAWTYPLTLETCRDLRAAFGRRLLVGPELTAWAHGAVAKENEVRPLLSAVDASLTNLPQRAPTLYRAMCNRPYQLPAVAFCVALGAALEADQPGLGKTLVGMAACVERWEGGNHLILAPKTSLSVVWEPELKRWLSDVEGGAKVFAVKGNRAQRNEILGAAMDLAASPDRPAHIFVVANTEMVRVKEFGECTECDGMLEKGKCEYNSSHKIKTWHEEEYPQLFGTMWNSIIVDESHKSLIRTGGQETQTRRGMVRLGTGTPTDQLRIPMTGTPFKGKTKNLWGTLNWALPKTYTSFWSWANSYLTVESNGYGHDIGDVRPERKEAFYRSLDAIMIRRTKGELRKINPDWAPPAKLYETAWCEMEPKQAKAYASMEKDATATIGGGNLSANGVLAEMTRLKQFAHAYGALVPGKDGPMFKPALPSGKFSRMLQDLEERGISGDPDQQGGDLKVVIGSQFTAMLDLYSAELNRLGIEHFLLTGATSDKRRMEYTKRFQSEGGPRLFLINTTAGGVSITLDAADELWILDETWVPDEQEQLEDRIHRVSNVDHQVTIRYFTTKNTIEESIAEVTMGKDETQREHLDGRRGVALAMRILTREESK